MDSGSRHIEILSGYEKANDLLANFAHMTVSIREQFFKAVIIQLVFVGAFICLTLVIEKYKRVEK